MPAIEAHLSNEDRHRFLDVIVALKSELHTIVPQLPVQRLYGDLHSANILIHEGDFSGFVDLDHLPLGPAVYDLAYLLVDRVKRKIEDVATIETWRQLIVDVIEGYRETNNLSRLEYGALWPIMCAVQLLFAEFFFTRGDIAEVQLNLHAFLWLAEGWRLPGGPGSIPLR